MIILRRIFKVNKTELITAIAAKAEISKKDADKALSAFIDTVTSELKAGSKVQIVGFGSFEARTRAARKGINPLTKQEITIPETTVPAFKAGRGLKDALQK